MYSLSSQPLTTYSYMLTVQYNSHNFHLPVLVIFKSGRNDYQKTLTSRGQLTQINT
jgi:hypothetical protein